MEVRKLAGKSLQRELRFERGLIDEEARTVEVAFASETPYERSWGMEILSMDPAAVRLGRLASGGAVLVNHDTDDQVGVVESVRLDADRMARAVLRFGRSQRAQEVFQDVLDGVRRLVSVGYLIHEVKAEDSKATLPVYRVTDWEPFEVSLVAVPADPRVGVGRSVAADEVAPPIVDTPVIHQNETTAMSETIQPAAPVDANAIRAAETARINEILALGRAHGQMDLAQQFLDKPVEQFKSALLELKRSAPVPSAGDVGLTSAEAQKFSVVRLMRALADGQPKGAEFEFEVSRALGQKLGRNNAGRVLIPAEVLRRDLTTTPGSSGGALVQTEFGDFVSLLRNRSVTMAMGATRLTGLKGDVTLPRQTGAATAQWLPTELTQGNPTDQAFGQIALTPKNVTAYTQYSKQLLAQSAISVESIVMNDLAAVVALAVDAAAINGSGAGGQPQGILNTSGIGSVSGGTLGYAGVLEFQSDVMAANALVNPATAGYVASPVVAALLAGRSRFSNTDTPLWDGSLSDGRMAGYAARACTNMPNNSTAIFGDWSQLVIAEWGVLELEVNPYADFRAGVVGMRAWHICDVALRYPASFSASTNVT